MTPLKPPAKDYRILLLEDHRSDADQIIRLLKKSEMRSEVLVVATRANFENALSDFRPDVILSDHNLPSFSSMEALALLRKTGSDIPFILVTGTVSEEFAVEAMRSGADDYVLKDRMQRLPLAVSAALEKFEMARQQREAELKIRESEAKYRAVFENSMDGMLVLETNGRIITANPSACKMLGMTPDELSKLFKTDILGTSDTGVPEPIAKQGESDHEKGEVDFIRKDGSRFCGELTSSAFADGNGEKRIAIIFRDITERKKAAENQYSTSLALEKALRDRTKIMDSSLDMICAVDEGGKFIQVSAACYAILGYTQKEMIGKSITDLVHPDDLEKTTKTADGVMSGRNVINFENRYVRKDGSIVHLVWSARWDPNERVRYGVARDATEIKKAESIISSERQRMAELFMNAPIAMCILKGKDHVFDLANPIYLQKTGKSNLKGKTVKEVFPELEAQGYLKILDHVYDTGESFAFNEMQIKIDREGNGDLTLMYHNMVQQPYRGANGDIEGSFYFGVDVTDQVLSRKKIEETEQRYRQIVETAQEGIWVVDENERTIFVNNKLCELFEYERTEMIGKEIYDFMDDEARNQAVASMKKRREGKSGTGHFKYISKSGREVWTNIAANPLFNEYGTYKGSLAMITDITEQKKAEEDNKKLAMVASLTVNAVIVTDATGRITWVNKGFERITEFTFEECVGKKPGEFLQGAETDKSTVEVMSHLIKSGEGFRVEIINYAKSGRRYWLDIEVVPLHDAIGKLTGFMAIEQDITDRKKSQRETSNLIERLEAKNKNLQQFSYIVSHNLRGPISKIMALANAVEVEEPENKLLIEKISDEANQLDGIIKDMNTIVAARQLDTLQMQRISFENKFKAVAHMLEDQIAESNAKIHTDFSQATDIVSVKSYVFSIMYNLLSNAIKYRKPTVAPEIFVATSHYENFICLAITDNGMGIDLEKNKDKIFGLYRRFHGNSIPGKGMGLNLVKTHTESLGGKIKVKSQIDKGTTFHIYLPKNYGNDLE